MRKNCAYCDQPFEAKGRGRFCSDSHRVMGHRKAKGLPLSPFQAGQSSSSTIEKLEKEIKRLKAENELNGEKLSAAVSIIKWYYLGKHNDPKLAELAKALLAKYQAEHPASEMGITAPEPPKGKAENSIIAYLEATRKKG